MRFLLCCVFLFTLAAPAEEPVRFEYRTVGPTLIQRRLERVTRKNADRQAALESMFFDVGCKGERLTHQRVPHSREPNVVCTLPGEGSTTVVVGAHFDANHGSSGVLDNWSGAALLPSLYESLSGTPRRHTFVFVGFAAEEGGLLGSAAYVKQLSHEKNMPTGLRAMVNLECLGLTSPEVWGSRADTKLLNLYSRAAATLSLQPASVSLDRVAMDDSFPFQEAGIPTITFHSMTKETLRLLHSRRDDIKAINPEDYYSAYRLTALYLAELDSIID